MRKAPEQITNAEGLIFPEQHHHLILVSNKKWSIQIACDCVQGSHIGLWLAVLRHIASIPSLFVTISARVMPLFQRSQDSAISARNLQSSAVNRGAYFAFGKIIRHVNNVQLRSFLKCSLVSMHCCSWNSCQEQCIIGTGLLGGTRIDYCCLQQSEHGRIPPPFVIHSSLFLGCNRRCNKRQHRALLLCLLTCSSKTFGRKFCLGIVDCNKHLDVAGGC